MFYDPATGKYIITPEDLKKVDPLILKLRYCPETLTPEQTQEAHLRVMSAGFNFLPLAELKKTLASVTKSVAKHGQKQPPSSLDLAAIDMLAGKIAIREMGLATQSFPGLYEYADAMDKERKRRRAAKRKRAKEKALRAKSAGAKGTAKKKPAATPAKRPRKTRKHSS